MTALALLAIALWRLVATLGTDAAPRVHLRLDGGVLARTRDSLAARARAGETITWSGAVASLAVMTEPVREPAAGTRLSVLGERPVALGDGLGDIDSIAAGGGTLATSAVRGTFTAREGPTEARAAPRDGTPIGRVLVLGRVGWESKFVIAALEEEGWRVDARLRLGDTLQVVQGAGADPTVGTHAAVVVLDVAVGARSEALERYVRSGGGLVLAGEGAGPLDGGGTRPRGGPFGTLVPAQVTRMVGPEADALLGARPLRGLPLHALGALRADAVVLEDRDGTPAVVARRVGAGRVVQSGYIDTWRWRMQGEQGSVVAHRAFWSRLVGTAAASVSRPSASSASSAVSAATRATSASIGAATEPDDPAPLAALVHALGHARSDAPSSAGRSSRLPLWLGALILLLLVGEWASRRARGAA